MIMKYPIGIQDFEKIIQDGYLKSMQKEIEILIVLQLNIMVYEDII